MSTTASPGPRLRRASPSHRRSWILASFVTANVAACAALDFGADGGTPTGGGYGGSGSTSATGGTIDFDASTGAGGSSAGDYAHLCGRGSCDPSESAAVSSCEGSPGMGGAGTGGSGGAANGAGGAGVGGVGGAANGTGGMGVGGVGGSTNGAGGFGGVGGVGGAANGTGGVGVGGAANGVGGSGGGSGVGGIGGAANGAGGSGGANGAGGDPTGGAPPALVSECKLVLAGDGVERACVPSGSYGEQSPCNTAADCGAGLGCVLVSAQGTGVCREYCCGDLEACPQQTYCAPRPMAEAAGADVQVPVCVDADDCTLLEEGQCAEGLMCTVVRADGTTACIPIGDGGQGESCPCAPGFTCSKLVNQCRQICHTEPQASGSECEPGFECQGNSSMPEGFGVCVSTG